jgi:hypothetical protein
MWGMCVPPKPEFEVGTIIYRRSDDRKLKIDQKSTDPLSKKNHFKLVGEDGFHTWVSEAELKVDYTKTDPYEAQRKYCKDFGYKWEGPK